MSIRRKLIKAVPLVLACSVAGAAATWTPIACGCLSAWEDVAAGIDLPGVTAPGQLSAQVIAGALAKKLSGKTVKVSDLPFATSTYDCAESQSPSRTIRCRWWLWESGLSKKGYDVIVDTSATGEFRRVHVVPVEYSDPMGKDGT